MVKLPLEVEDSASLLKAIEYNVSDPVAKIIAAKQVNNFFSEYDRCTNVEAIKPNHQKNDSIFELRALQMFGSFVGGKNQISTSPQAIFNFSFFFLVHDFFCFNIVTNN